MVRVRMSQLSDSKFHVLALWVLEFKPCVESVMSAGKCKCMMPRLTAVITCAIVMPRPVLQPDEYFVVVSVI